jgi:hypothetical protein
MAKPKLNVSDTEAAIEKYSGNLTAVAKYFGVARMTVYRKIAKHASLQEALETARETMLDNVESTLYKQALEGNTTSMIFFLKTQGKSRGYVERQEHTGEDGEPLFPTQQIVAEVNKQKNGSKDEQAQ